MLDTRNEKVKLFFGVVQSADAEGVAETLVEQGFRFTRIETAGGFLREGNVTFMVGVEERRLGELLGSFRRGATTRVQIANQPQQQDMQESGFPFPFEIQVGGATVLMLDVDRVEPL
jgi:uncharacterized protein YaaQ